MNEFYTATGNPATGSTATSATMRAEFNAIVAAFDKLPTMTGNGNKILLVNPSGTGLTTSAAIAEVAGNVTISGSSTFSGAVSLSSTLGVTGATTLSNTLGVTGATTLSNTLGVTGAATFNSSVSVGTTLGVTGVATLGANSTVGGAVIVDVSSSQTLTNKTLTNPTINGFTGSTAVVNIGSGQFYKDTAGNIGVGLTPSAWGAGQKAIEIKGFGNALVSSGANQIILAANAYYNSGWFYGSSSTASYYQQISGAHQWYNAPSGTAGNPITFTQAMTLDASGNLLLGSTSSVGARLMVYPSASNGLEVLNGGLTATNLRMFFRAPGAGSTVPVEIQSNGAYWVNSAGTNTMTLDANGNLGVGMTPDALLSVNGPGRFGPSTVGTALSGTFYTSSLSDTFTVDTNKVLHNYGISAKTFSDVAGAPSLAITGYAGIRFYTAQIERVRIDTAGNINAFAAINESQGATVASASTINLTTATGNLVHVSGTTTITGITLAQGYRRIVVFDGALTLTNGASLILPGAANITTAAGDSAVFVGESAGVVRCVAYVRANGYPLLSGFGSSLAGSGYQKLPSGMILQWGSSITSSGSVTVTFPIAFPTAVLSVTSSAVRTVSTNNSVGPNTPGLSNCTFYDQAGAATTFFWMAVGN